MTHSTEPSHPDRPKFRRRAKHRPDEVLDAALALFAQKGYGKTSVDAIARAAGISKGAVYLYFPSKQAILEGLVERAIAPFRAGVLAQVTHHTGTVRETITLLLSQLGKRLADPATLATPKLVLREALVAPEIAGMYRRAVLDQVMPAMIALIGQGIETGEFRPVDPELTVRSLMGPVIVHLMLAEIFAIQPADGPAVEAMIENHLSVLFDGLAAERSV